MPLGGERLSRQTLVTGMALSRAGQCVISRESSILGRTDGVDWEDMMLGSYTVSASLKSKVQTQSTCQSGVAHSSSSPSCSSNSSLGIPTPCRLP